MSKNPFKQQRQSGGGATGDAKTPSKTKGGRSPRASATRSGFKRAVKKATRTMELMREACAPYNWSRASWNLMVGEHMVLDPKQGAASDSVTYSDVLQRKVTGLLYITNFQLRFYPSRHVKVPASFFRVPLATIARIEVPDQDNKSSPANSAPLRLHCKDGEFFNHPLSLCHLYFRDVVVTSQWCSTDLCV